MCPMLTFGVSPAMLMGAMSGQEGTMGALGWVCMGGMMWHDAWARNTTKPPNQLIRPTNQPTNRPTN